jgi:hypothetical protein
MRIESAESQAGRDEAVHAMLLDEFLKAHRKLEEQQTQSSSSKSKLKL